MYNHRRLGAIMHLSWPVIVTLLSSASIASGQPVDTARIAISIGNRDYESLSDLRNSENDAVDIASALRQHNFDVTLSVNQSAEEFSQEFEGLLSKAEASKKDGKLVDIVLYYAGHGVSRGGLTYLLPVDYPSDNFSRLGLRANAVDLEYIVGELSQFSDRLILILDSCRNDPFAGLPPSGDRGAVSTGMSYLTNVPVGSAILYCAGVGQTSKDFLPSDNPLHRTNGVCTRYLLQEIGATDVSFYTIAEKVQTNVYEATRQYYNPAQAPGIYDQMIGDFYFGNRPKDTAEALKIEKVLAGLTNPSTSPVATEVNDEIAAGDWVFSRAPPVFNNTIPAVGDIFDRQPLLGIPINIFFSDYKVEDAQRLARNFRKLGASVNQASKNFNVSSADRGVISLLYLSDLTEAEKAAYQIILDELLAAPVNDEIVTTQVNALRSGPFTLHLY